MKNHVLSNLYSVSYKRRKLTFATKYVAKDFFELADMIELDLGNVDIQSVVLLDTLWVKDGKVTSDSE